MVLGSHLIITAYGFWLPNDPRGSWSKFVGSWELARFGRATKTDDPRSVARVPHDRAARLAAKQALRYRPVRFSGVQARAVGRGFAAFVRRSGVRVWACSIMPEHAHLVIARHRYDARQVASLLKGEATRQLLAEELHPMADARNARGRPPSPWAARSWAVFLDSPRGVRRAIEYVENNPAKEGLPPQHWSFVTPYEP